MWRNSLILNPKRACMFVEGAGNGNFVNDSLNQSPLSEIFFMLMVHHPGKLTFCFSDNQVNQWVPLNGYQVEKDRYKTAAKCSLAQFHFLQDCLIVSLGPILCSPGWRVICKMLSSVGVACACFTGVAESCCR